MKVFKLSLVLFLITNLSVSAQNTNQLDANGKRHGVWKKTFDNTSILRYEGTFLHGKEIGVFKFYKKINNKASLTATKKFNDTNTIAVVKFYSSRGKLISEGEMNGKTYLGDWKYYQKNSNQLLILEHYNNHGYLEGERFVYYKNGQIAEKQNYLDGKLNGESIWYSDTNTVLKHYIYVNGQLHGKAKFYNPKGILLTEGQYKKDKKNGVWKFYKNGKLIEEKDFSYKPKYNKK